MIGSEGHCDNLNIQMLIRYSAENYRSLKDCQELSFVAGAYKDHPEFQTRVPSADLDLLRVAVIYGPNASGKSNVLASLRFIANAVKRSFKDWDPAEEIPLRRFKFGDADERPSSFTIDFLLDGVRHEYGFTAEKREFSEEWLYAYPNRTKNLWFSRRRGEYRFGKALTGTKNRIRSVTRSNSLFLSAAAQNNHSQLLPVYRWFTDRLIFEFGDHSNAPTSKTAKMCSDDSIRARVLKHMRAADLGIVDISVAKEDTRPEVGEFVSAIEKFVGRPIPTPELHKIRLVHSGSEAETGVEFSVNEESRGTQKYFVLIGQVINALQSGAILVIDELDSSLHPLLALELVALFNNPSTNPKSAQLLFNTHDTNLLNSKYLRRDQIWFAEKDSGGGTHVYPLSDFKARNDENLEKGYLQGRYGAVPFITNSALILLNKDGQETS